MNATMQLRVLDFDCPTCASTVERALATVEGVQRVEVFYTTGRIEIHYDDTVVTPDTFERTIENRGYTPQPA